MQGPANPPAGMALFHSLHCVDTASDTLSYIITDFHPFCKPFAKIFLFGLYTSFYNFLHLGVDKTTDLCYNKGNFYLGGMTMLSVIRNELNMVMVCDSNAVAGSGLYRHIQISN